MISIYYHGDKKSPFLEEIGLIYRYLYGMGYEAAILFTFNQTQL